MKRPALHVHTRCATTTRDLDCTYAGEAFRVREGEGEPVEVAIEDFLDHVTDGLTDDDAAAEADLAVIVAYEREWSPVLVGCRRAGRWQDLSAGGARPVTWLDVRSQLCAIAASLIEASGRVVAREAPRDPRDAVEVGI